MSKKHNNLIKKIAITISIMFAVTLLNSGDALASKQCVKNMSATSLDVTFYNAAGKKDKKASNHDLTVGMQTCQNNKNVGSVRIKCNGCQFADDIARGAVVVGGVALVAGACMTVAAPACAGAGATGAGASMSGLTLAMPVISAAIIGGTLAIPNSEEGSKRIFIKKGKTVTVTGTAFKIEIKGKKEKL